MSCYSPFGKDPRGMPPGVLTTGAVTLAGIRIQYLQLLIPLLGLALAAGLQTFFARRRDTAKHCLRWCKTKTPRG